MARPALRMTGIFLSIASLLFFELVNGMLTNVGGFTVDKLVSPKVGCTASGWPSWTCSVMNLNCLIGRMVEPTQLASGSI